MFSRSRKSLIDSQAQHQEIDKTSQEEFILKKVATDLKIMNISTNPKDYLIHIPTEE